MLRCSLVCLCRGCHADVSGHIRPETEQLRIDGVHNPLQASFSLEIGWPKEMGEIIVRMTGIQSRDKIRIGTASRMLAQASEGR